MPEQSTLTIRFICPHCLEEHGLNFPSSWLTKPKTSHRLTMQCSNNLPPKGLLRLVIRINLFTPSAEQSKKGWIPYELIITWKKKLFLYLLDVHKPLSDERNNVFQVLPSQSGQSKEK